MGERKHARVIKAWADGVEVEIQTLAGDWVDVKAPSFSENFEYRIKRDPQLQAVIDAHAAGKRIQYRRPGGEWSDVGDDEPAWFESLEYRVRPRLWDFVLALREGKTLQARFTDRHDTWDDQSITEATLERAEDMLNLEYRIKPTHRHQELFDKLKREGGQLQFMSKLSPHGKWVDLNTPPSVNAMDEHYEYRIKPETMKYRVSMIKYGGVTGFDVAWTERAAEVISTGNGFARWVTDWVEVEV